MGWVPIKALDSDLANTVTNLEIGKVSDPVQNKFSSTTAASTQQESTLFSTDGYRKITITEVDPHILVLYKATDDRLAEYTMSTQKISLLGKGSSVDMIQPLMHGFISNREVEGFPRNYIKYYYDSDRYYSTELPTTTVHSVGYKTSLDMRKNID